MRVVNLINMDKFQFAMWMAKVKIKELKDVLFKEKIVAKGLKKDQLINLLINVMRSLAEKEVAADDVSDKKQQPIEIKPREQRMLDLKEVEGMSEEDKELFIKKSNKKQLKAILVESGKDTEELIGLDKVQLEILLEDILMPLEQEKNVEVELDAEELTVGEYFNNYINSNSVKTMYGAKALLNRYIYIRDRIMSERENKLIEDNIINEQINRYVESGYDKRDVGLLRECG